MRQRSKERNQLSIFFIVFFIAIFVVIILTEVFFIDERNEGVRISDKRPDDFDGMGDIPDYLMDDKKLIRELEIDSYRRQELSVKNSHDDGVVHKKVDETRLNARVSGSLLKSLRASERKSSWNAINDEKATIFTANTSAVDAQWLPVLNARHKFYVYSAFYDDRKGKIIRIIGATLTKRSDRVWCKYWYSNSSALVLVGAVKIIRENWNLRYSACFIACPLTIYTNGKQPIPPPESISVMADPAGNVTNKLKVLNTDINKDAENKFAVCIKPLHFDYNNINQIIEFIELNKLIGVEHFTLYNHTIGPEVACVLENYVKQGLITILPWKLNIKSQKEIRTEGLFAALNDCLYRYMYRYKYLLMIDLDEYIVPHSNTTLPELVTFLNTRADVRKIGAISFQNSFFYLQWPDDPSRSVL